MAKWTALALFLFAGCFACAADLLDVSQPDYGGDVVLVYYRHWASQSFVPTQSSLSKIDLALKWLPSGCPLDFGDLEFRVEVRDSSDNTVGSRTFSANTLYCSPNGVRWISLRFEQPLEVEAGELHKIILFFNDGGASSAGPAIGWAKSSNVYANGRLQYVNDAGDVVSSDDDLAFKTYYAGNTCVAGWTCRDSSTRIQVRTDCSVVSTQACPSGTACSAGACTPVPLNVQLQSIALLNSSGATVASPAVDETIQLSAIVVSTAGSGSYSLVRQIVGASGAVKYSDTSTETITDGATKWTTKNISVQRSWSADAPLSYRASVSPCSATCSKTTSFDVAWAPPRCTPGWTCLNTETRAYAYENCTIVSVPCSAGTQCVGGSCIAATPVPTATPSPEPSPLPSPAPTATPTPSPSPTPVPTATPSPTPVPAALTVIGAPSPEIQSKTIAFLQEVKDYFGGDWAYWLSTVSFVARPQADDVFKKPGDWRRLAYWFAASDSKDAITVYYPSSFPALNSSYPVSTLCLSNAEKCDADLKWALSRAFAQVALAKVSASEIVFPATEFARLNELARVHETRLTATESGADLLGVSKAVDNADNLVAATDLIVLAGKTAVDALAVVAYNADYATSARIPLAGVRIAGLPGAPLVTYTFTAGAETRVVEWVDGSAVLWSSKLEESSSKLAAWHSFLDKWGTGITLAGALVYGAAQANGSVDRFVAFTGTRATVSVNPAYGAAYAGLKGITYVVRAPNFVGKYFGVTVLPPEVDAFAEYADRSIERLLSESVDDFAANVSACVDGLPLGNGTGSTAGDAAMINVYVVETAACYAFETVELAGAAMSPAAQLAVMSPFVYDLMTRPILMLGNFSLAGYPQPGNTVTFYVDAANLKGLPTWVSSLTGETGYVQPIVSGQTGETGKIASFAVPPKQVVLPTGKSQRLFFRFTIPSNATQNSVYNVTFTTWWHCNSTACNGVWCDSKTYNFTLKPIPVKVIKPRKTSFYEGEAVRLVFSLAGSPPDPFFVVVGGSLARQGTACCAFSWQTRQGDAGTYPVFYSAYDGRGGQASGSLTLTIKSSKPIPRSPVRNAMVSSKPVFAWNAPRPMRYYSVSVYSRAGALIGSYTSRWTSLRWKTKLKSGNYYWEVTGWDSNGNAFKSDAAYFRVS